MRETEMDKLIDGETEAPREDVIRTSTQRVSGRFQMGTRVSCHLAVSPASFSKASFHSEASWTPGDGARAAEGPSCILGQD